MGVLGLTRTMMCAESPVLFSCSRLDRRKSYRCISPSTATRAPRVSIRSMFSSFGGSWLYLDTDVCTQICSSIRYQPSGGLMQCTLPAYFSCPTFLLEDYLCN